MNNEHLIPINIIDIAEKLSKATNENEVNNYLHRLEVTRDYCINVINTHLRDSRAKKSNINR